MTTKNPSLLRYLDLDELITDADLLVADGSRAGATGQAQDFGSNGILADAIEGSSSNNVSIQGLRHFGALAANPFSGAEGDRYYNTVLQMEMTYDSSRGKWLSVESSRFAFGRTGATPAGSFFRAMDNQLMSATAGYPADFDGTVVSFDYTRSDSDNSIFRVVASGTNIASVSTSSVSGQDTTLDGDFNQGDVLAVKVSAGGNTMSDVNGSFRVRWRA
jgi:hypothetical protein